MFICVSDLFSTAKREREREGEEENLKTGGCQQVYLIN